MKGAAIRSQCSPIPECGSVTASAEQAVRSFNLKRSYPVRQVAVARAVYEAAGRPAIAPKRNGHFAAAYGYTDESGQVLFECVRFAEPKGFAQRHSDVKGGYIWNLKGVRLVPYRLPKIITANRIFICEGEKDCSTWKGSDSWLPAIQWGGSSGVPNSTSTFATRKSS